MAAAGELLAVIVTQALISPEHSHAKPAKLAAAGGLLAKTVSVWHLKSVADFQAIKPAAADWSSA